MKFDDIYTAHEDRFSIGIERSSGRYYLSIPVSNGLVEYEEYYEIDRFLFDRINDCFEDARGIAKKSRMRLNDEKLIEQPGERRGSPI
jgi:hypothetical protein